MTTPEKHVRQGSDPSTRAASYLLARLGAPCAREKTVRGISVNGNTSVLHTEVRGSNPLSSTLYKITLLVYDGVTVDSPEMDIIMEKARNADRALYELKNMMGTKILDLGRIQCILEGKLNI